MTIMKKIWFVDGKIIEEQIPEETIYDPSWCLEYCKAYAERLKDKTQANRAEHAAQCIEYLLSLVQKEWVGLTKEDIAKNIYAEGEFMLPYSFARSIETMLKEKNA